MSPPTTSWFRSSGVAELLKRPGTGKYKRKKAEQERKERWMRSCHYWGRDWDAEADLLWANLTPDQRTGMTETGGLLEITCKDFQPWQVVAINYQGRVDGHCVRIYNHQLPWPTQVLAMKLWLETADIVWRKVVGRDVDSSEFMHLLLPLKDR